MNDEVSKYEELHFRNIYIGSIEKWQKTKLLITKNNKKGHCNTVSHSEMGFHNDRADTLHLEMHRAKLFTNSSTIYYCLKCRNEVAKCWLKKKVFLINVRLQSSRLKQPGGFLPSNRSQLFSPHKAEMTNKVLKQQVYGQYMVNFSKKSLCFQTFLTLL